MKKIGELRVSHVSSFDHLAKALTKSLSCLWFHHLCSKIDVSNETTILWGHVGDSLG